MARSFFHRFLVDCIESQVAAAELCLGFPSHYPAGPRQKYKEHCPVCSPSVALAVSSRRQSVRSKTARMVRRRLSSTLRRLFAMVSQKFSATIRWAPKGGNSSLPLGFCA
jgi:hypothetical protein